MGLSGKLAFRCAITIPLVLMLRQNFNVPDQQCSAQDVVDFMNATQAYMDSTDWVERYAWFGAMKDMSGVNQVSL